METIKSIGLILFEVFIFVIATLIVGGVVFGALYALSGNVPESDSNSLDPYNELINNFLPLTIAVVAGLIFVKRLCFPLSEQILGFDSNRIFKDSYIGWGYGLVLVGVGFLLMLLFQLVDITGFDWNFNLFIGFIFLFIIQSFSEEVIFRSFLIPTIAQRLNTFWALIISSIIFAVVHLTNPNVSIMGITNLILGGLLMGLLFIKFKNIWAPTGFHASWNFVQSAFLGYPVSGINTYSLIELEETGPDFLSGGKFGYEGSIISVVILLLSIIWLLRRDEILLRRLSFRNNSRVQDII